MDNHDFLCNIDQIVHDKTIDKRQCFLEDNSVLQPAPLLPNTGQFTSGMAQLTLKLSLARFLSVNFFFPPLCMQ